MKQFFDAIKSNNLDTVSRFIASAKDVVMFVNKANKGCTPLFIAAQNDHVEIAQLLMERGADVNQAKNNGCTPLYIAAKEGHTKVKLVG